MSTLTTVEKSFGSDLDALFSRLSLRIRCSPYLYSNTACNQDGIGKMVTLESFVGQGTTGSVAVDVFDASEIFCVFCHGDGSFEFFRSVRSNARMPTLS